MIAINYWEWFDRCVFLAILYYSWRCVRIEKATYKLYKDYFDERKAWREAQRKSRTKKEKPSEERKEADSQSSIIPTAG